MLTRKMGSVILVIFFCVLSATNVSADYNIPQDINKFVNKWAQAWQDGKLQKYKQFYSPSFNSQNNRNLKEYIAHKKQIHEKNQIVWIAVEEVQIVEHSEKRVELSFRQHYISSQYSDVGIKHLSIQKKDRKWKIVQEKYNPIQNNVKYSVQLLPFSNHQKAIEVKEKIENKEYDPYIIENVDYNGNKVSALRLGDFVDKSAAKEVARQYRENNKRYAFITRVDSLDLSDESTTNSNTEKNYGENKKDEHANLNFCVHIYPFEKRKGVLDFWSRYKKKDWAANIRYVLIEKRDNDSFGLYTCGLGKLEAKKKVEEFNKDGKIAKIVKLNNLGYWEKDFNILAEKRLATNNQIYSLVQDKPLDLIYARGEGGPTLGTQSSSAEDKSEEKSKEDSEGGPQLGGSDSSESMKSLKEDLKKLKEQVEDLKQEKEARETLRISEEERQEKEEELLETAGREYTMRSMGTLGLNYSFGYSYYSHDIIEQLREDLQVKHQANHSINNSINISYALLDNLTLNVSLPFVYKYHKVGTEDSKKVTDIGDISIGGKIQPIKSGSWLPSPIFSLNLSTPTGRSQYEINPETELATGSGQYSLNAGISMNKAVDPVNLFGSLNYSYSTLADNIYQRRSNGILVDVEPGESLSASMGLGYSLSYKVSLSLSYSFSYSFETKYKWENREPTSSGTSVGSSLSISTGLNLTPTHRVIVGIGTGLTDENSGFNFSFRWPFQYELI